MKKQEIKIRRSFESNELKLAELETELNIKLGVLGELFGVARQMAGELQADSDLHIIFLNIQIEQMH
ncbi:MAG: hypothetical protein CM15mP126_0380 [Gammaproteobacteria bacterium]|nr:MAG: hypothetical protein CM15mP126_0380 [Gammaproteobacteria bacterium]